MNRSELNTYVKNVAESIWATRHDATKEAMFNIVVAIVAAIVVGREFNAAWGAITLVGTLVGLFTMGALSDIAAALDLNARARALQAVAALRATDD